MLSQFGHDPNMLCDEFKRMYDAGQSLDPSYIGGDGGVASDVAAQEELETPVFKDEKEEGEYKYWKKLQANDFVFPAQGFKGNLAGGRWQRHINNKRGREDKEKYEALKGDQSALEKFRADWARKLFEAKYESAKHTKTHELTTFSDARYFTLMRIAEEEGRGPRGIRNAVLYALQCLAMGGKWLKYSRMRRDMVFLYMTEGIYEAFSEKWELTKT
eukprot:9473879-Pyramimonas_sp.AAC.2